MVNILSYLILAFILATAIFSLMMHYLTIDNTKPEKVEKQYYRKKQFLRNILKYSFAQKIEKWLTNAGNPFGITTESYMVLSVISFFAAVFAGLRGGPSNSIKVLILVLIPLNLLIYYCARQRKQKLQLELCNIQDVFYFQSRIGTPTDVILAYASRTCGEPLKTPLSTLAEKYSVQKNMDRALEEFRKTSNLVDFQAFTFILDQKERTGFSSENHHAQAIMLKRSKRMKRRIEREYKRLKLVIAAVLMFICYIMFTAVPLLKSVLNSLNLILR